MKIKRYTFSFFLLLLFSTSLSAQCLSGNCINGYGVFECSNGKYKGEFVNGERDGYGIYFYDTGGKYKGEWKKNEKSGQGILIKRNGDRYEGQWQDNQFHGKGKFFWANGYVYDGEWQNGEREGQGTYYMAESKYVGSFSRGRFHGQGVLYYGAQVYQSGTWAYGHLEHPSPTNDWANGSTSDREPTIHVIAFTDTTDPMAKSAGIEARRYMQYNFIPALRLTSEMKMKTYVKSDQDFQLSQLETTLDQLQTGPNDAIFFYYTGHGYNRNSNEFPTLTLGNNGEPLYERQIDLKKIYDQLKAKDHRLLVVVAEACNRERQSSHLGRAQSLTANLNTAEFSHQKVQQLFKEASGNYIVCSSKKGQDSYLISNGVGFFLKGFMDAFASVVRRGSAATVSWDSIWELVSENTSALARMAPDVEDQNPYYESER